MRIRSKWFAAALGAATMTIHPAIATAEEAADSISVAIPEIIVTADYRRRAINDVPLSLSVIDEDAIARRNAQHLEDLLGMVPNLNYSGGTSRARFFQIRGVGDLEQFDAPLNSSVGVIVDNVDFSGAATIVTLFDVEQVEVLRGPQGTRYGANALAGLINVKTNDPSESFEAMLRAEAANYDSYGLGGVVSGPINERLLYRIAAQSYQSDGFIDNTFLNREDTNDRDELTLRAKLRWYATDDLTLDLHGTLVDVDNGYDAFSLDNDRNTRSDEPGTDSQKMYMVGVNTHWHAAPAFDVEGIIGYATSDIDYGYDEDWTFVGFHPFEYSSTDSYQRDRETFNAEIRFISNEAGRIIGGRAHWVFGLYAINQEVDLKRNYTFLPGPFTSDFDTRRFAVFGQLETTLDDRFTLTTGLRWEHRSAEYHDSEAVNFDPDENLVGGRVVLDYVLNANTMLYASISRGYKAGGFNTDGTLDPDLRPFDSEFLWNYEIGLKGSWFDNRFGARVAAFYMDRDDVQISSSVVRVRPDGSSEFIAFTGNAAEGNNAGLEVELDFAPIPDLLLTANVGLLDSEYVDFVNSSGEDLGGRDQAHAPSYQFYIAGEYAFLEHFFARLEIEGRDEFFYADRHNESSDPYELVHASIGFERGRVRATLWARNLTDENYHVRGFFFGNDPRNGYVAESYTQLGEPRRIGGTVALSM
ncbi:MAG: TonB-dependent receptor [Gammaproteobacteria bacterium]|nr:TonB-dependent receptor [Gammaproteobacteria bacterium]